MKQEKNKEEKRKTGMARCLELASEHKGLVLSLIHISEPTRH